MSDILQSSHSVKGHDFGSSYSDSSRRKAMAR